MHIMFQTLYNLCSYIFQFFTQNAASDDSFTPSAPEFDFDEVENNVRYCPSTPPISVPCAEI